MHVLALAGLVAFLAAQPAMAVISTQDQLDALHVVADGGAAIVATLGAPDVGAPDMPDVPIAYLDDAGNIWEESNGVPGLQTHGFTDAAGMAHGADDFVGGIGTLQHLPL